MKKLIERIEKLEKEVREIKNKIDEKGKITNIQCDKCQYKWFTKSKMDTISCPNCGSKIKTNSIVKVDGLNYIKNKTPSDILED